MANDKVPYDAKVAIANAEVVDQMAKLPWAGFVAGTDKMPNGDQVRHDISELLDAGSGPT